jgi:ectoine hydroxylase-related dioxygenase (phytanoyl-CoA dioxygenase family)
MMPVTTMEIYPKRISNILGRGSRTSAGSISLLQRNNCMYCLLQTNDASGYRTTAQNTDQVVVQVSKGTLLMFPAYLWHSVARNESDELRISISFNLMFSFVAENLSKPLWRA